MYAICIVGLGVTEVLRLVNETRHLSSTCVKAPPAYNQMIPQIMCIMYHNWLNATVFIVIILV